MDAEAFWKLYEDALPANGMEGKALLERFSEKMSCFCAAGSFVARKESDACSYIRKLS
jgi:hypothetical protein